MLSFYFAFLNHVSVNEVGIAYNSISGEIKEQRHPGFYVTSPATIVGYLSTLPTKVTIPSDAKIINSKIVKFNPDYLNEFIKDQGFKWGLSNSQESIFLGFAYSGKKYPWLEIVQEGGMYNDSTFTK
jgi:hypothetical protein